MNASSWQIILADNLLALNILFLIPSHHILNDIEIGVIKCLISVNVVVLNLFVNEPIELKFNCWRLIHTSKLLIFLKLFF